MSGKKIPHRALASLLALGAALAMLVLLLVRWIKPSPLAPGSLLFPWEAQSLASVDLLRAGEHLRLERNTAQGHWQASGSQAPADESLCALLAFLRALRVEFPYVPAENDSVPDYLRRRGLTITQRNAAGDTLSYTLATWLEGRIVARSGAFYYTAHAAGYFPGIVHTIDLEPQSWSERRIWHGEPSDLHMLQLAWVEDPRQSFHIRRGEDSALQLFPFGSDRSLPFDSLRMATLLYAFADLPYAPLPDSMVRAYRHNPLSYPPYVRMALASHTEETGTYTLYRIPAGLEGGLDPNRAILQHMQKLYLVELAKWDAALVRLEDLQ